MRHMLWCSGDSISGFWARRHYGKKCTMLPDSCVGSGEIMGKGGTICWGCSQRYGLCETCGKPCSEQRRRIIIPCLIVAGFMIACIGPFLLWLILG